MRVGVHARERVRSYLKETKRRTNPAHMSKDIDKCVDFCTLCGHFFVHFSDAKALSIIRAF